MLSTSSTSSSSLSSADRSARAALDSMLMPPPPPRRPKPLQKQQEATTSTFSPVSVPPDASPFDSSLVHNQSHQSHHQQGATTSMEANKSTTASMAASSSAPDATDIQVAALGFLLNQVHISNGELICKRLTPTKLGQPPLREPVRSSPTVKEATSGQKTQPQPSRPGWNDDVVVNRTNHFKNSLSKSPVTPRPKKVTGLEVNQLSRAVSSNGSGTVETSQTDKMGKVGVVASKSSSRGRSSSSTRLGSSLMDTSRPKSFQLKMEESMKNCDDMDVSPKPKSIGKSTSFSNMRQFNQQEEAESAVVQNLKQMLSKEKERVCELEVSLNEKAVFINTMAEELASAQDEFIAHLEHERNLRETAEKHVEHLQQVQTAQKKDLDRLRNQLDMALGNPSLYISNNDGSSLIVDHSLLVDHDATDYITNGIESMSVEGRSVLENGMALLQE
ncbi:hypothetical protein HDU76_014040 [Blyttiomyces sp. JEL0837]|nr:hypothetical protein HDU76_014040 [Blyttiomyces sp. JEL0837]